MSPRQRIPAAATAALLVAGSLLYPHTTSAAPLGGTGDAGTPAPADSSSPATTAGATEAAQPTPDTASDDDVLLFTIDGADADQIEDLDAVTYDGDQIVVLGDASTEALLADRDVTPVSVTTYGAAVGEADRSATAASGTDFPLPERLAEASYETYFGGYRTVDAYTQFATDVAQAYPELVELVDFGDSWLKTQERGGHDLLALRITADVADQPAPTDGQEGRPRFTLVAQAHAREVITSELAWRYATELLNGYRQDAQSTALLDSTEVWITFQANPDGAAIVEDALAVAPVNEAGDAVPVPESQAWQRKNLNDTDFAPTSDRWSSQQPGVDLNRNFGFHWGEASTSSNPAAGTYKGTAPHSEPEVAASAELLTDLYGEFRAENDQAAPAGRTGTYVNLHSYSDYVIYPYAYDEAAPVPNLDAIRANGFRQSFANDFATGKAGEILYPNSGNDIDWIYAQLGVPAYTYEIGTAETGGFFPGYSRVEDFWEQVAPGIRFAAEAAHAPYTAGLGGVVTDVSVEADEDGTLHVSGAATDSAYGNDESSASRRPEETPITAVEAAVADSWTSVQETVALDVTEEGTTVDFTGTVPASARTVGGDASGADAAADEAADAAADKAADEADDDLLFVRAQNGSGEWGPWQSVFVDALAEPTPTDEPTEEPTDDADGSDDSDGSSAGDADSGSEGDADGTAEGSADGGSDGGADGGSAGDSTGGTDGSADGGTSGDAQGGSSGDADGGSEDDEAQGGRDDQGTLPRTGVEVGAAVGLAALLVGVGGAALAAARRRKA